MNFIVGVVMEIVVIVIEYDVALFQPFGEQCLKIIEVLRWLSIGGFLEDFRVLGRALISLVVLGEEVADWC